MYIGCTMFQYPVLLTSPISFKPRGMAKTETNEPDRYEWLNLGQDGLTGNVPLQPLPSAVTDQLHVFQAFLIHGQIITAAINIALATQLNLPLMTFTSLQDPSKESGTVIRLIRADPSPNPEDLRTSMMHHTDFGTITLLANVLGGLQILENESWAWVRPQPKCLIVNVGDAMVKWTGGVLKSNMHRINFAPGEQRFVERFSLAILFRPERNASMRTLVGDDGIDDEEEVLTAWEWETRKAMSFKR